MSLVVRKRERGEVEDSELLSMQPVQKKARKELHHLTMSKIYIQQIRNGEKTVEGRISKGVILKYLPGDKIRFYYYSNAKDDLTCQLELYFLTIDDKLDQSLQQFV